MSGSRCTPGAKRIELRQVPVQAVVGGLQGLPLSPGHGFSPRRVARLSGTLH